MASDLSQKTLELVNEEVRRIISEQYDAATRLLVEHRTSLDRLAEALLKHETISGEEVGAVLRGDTIEDYRAAQDRLRAAADSARRSAETPPPLPTAAPQPQKPDVGLSGA
jgi:cell division protease FtsH